MHKGTVYDTMKTGGEEMASIDKLVDKLKRQPNGISIDDADKVLTHYGYVLDRQKGSHKLGAMFGQNACQGEYGKIH